MDLAAHYGTGPVQSRDIAARQGLPEPYLNQLMISLRRAGMVSSKRGPTGGHALTRPPETISVRDAFAVLEGGAAPWWCVETAEPDCVYAAGCNLRPVWQAIDGAVAEVLGSMTLADLNRAGGTAAPGPSSGITSVGPRPRL